MNGGEQMLETIRSLAFVKAELELYLDTHPTCRAAIDYYHQTVRALDELTEQYQQMYGPITAAGSYDTERWQWVSTPWPWHRYDENVSDGGIG